MYEKKWFLRLDTKKQYDNEVITMVKQDTYSNVLYIVLYNDSIKMEVSKTTIATVIIDKPDNTQVIGSAEVLDNGTLKYVVDYQALAALGMAKFTVKLILEDNILTTTSFVVNVISDPFENTNGSIESTSEYPILTSLILGTTNIIASEEIRVDNENQRLENEETRTDNENERIANENIRKSNEITRQSNETTRQNNETNRTTKETERQTNETTRQNNEATRLSNETARQTADNTRQTNENTRIANENTRQSNESTRQTNEATRQSNESTRGSNETTRQTAETNRNTKENERQTNETTRQSNETTRQNNESTRSSNETTRQSNETARQSAETLRNTRETTREENENIRKTNETNRLSVETTRNTNETTRQNNETTRQSNENIRQDNEQLRVQLYNGLMAQLDRIEQIQQQVPEQVVTDLNIVSDLANQLQIDLDAHKAEIGNIEELNTNEKSSIVGSINEISTSLAEIASQVVYAENFRINGEADDTGLIERAIAYIENLNGKNELKFASNKTYTISKMIPFHKHKYTTFTGKGSVIKVASTVNESSPLPSMFDMSDTNPSLYQVGYFVCEDIEFNANNRALKIINGVNPSDPFKYGLYYTKFIKTKFHGIKQGGWGIYGLSWGTSVDSCSFLGFGEDPVNNTSHWCGNAILFASASNSSVITKTNFARLERVAEGNSDKVVFRDNIFDNIKKAPFKMRGVSLTIKDNYFEACGGQAELVNIYNLPSHEVDATIIYTGHPDDWPSMAKGLDVEGNVFTNNKAQNILALNHVYGVNFEKNSFNYMPEPINSLAYIFGHGLQYFGRKGSHGLKISRNNIEVWSTAVSDGRKLVNKIIDYSYFGNEINKGLENIQITDSLTFNNRQYSAPLNLMQGDFASLPDWTVTKETINSETVYKFTKTGNTSYNEIFLTKFLNKLKGSYVRLRFLTVNTQSAAPIRLLIRDGVKTTVYIPDGNKIDVNGDFAEMNSLFYVDKEATKLSFAIGSYCSVGQSIYIKDFIISPAHYDPKAYAEQ